MPQNFEIRVISLKNQLDRREKINNLFNNKNIRWSFFDAISGKDIQPFLHMYDRKKRLQTPGYDLRDNEIACFLSHRAVWQECLKENKSFLILEDDVSINTSLPHFLDSINSIIETVAENNLFIRLGNTFKKKSIKVHSINKNLNITRYYKDPYGGFGYLISPLIAKNLVDNSNIFWTPVDDFLWRGWDHDSCLLDIWPSLISTSDIDNPSSIGDRKKPKISLFKKIKREFFRTIENNQKNTYQKIMKLAPAKLDGQHSSDLLKLLVQDIEQIEIRL